MNEFRIDRPDPFPTDRVFTSVSRRVDEQKSRRLLSWCLIANLGVALFVLGWLLLDPRFEASVDWWRFARQTDGNPDLIRDMGDWWWLTWRNRTVLLLGVVVLFSLAIPIVGLFTGPRHHRRLAMWLSLTSLLAIWLAIAVQWRDVASLGKQWRLQQLLQEIDPVVASLTRAWPRHDGQHEQLGPFMAYPVSHPRTLILLTQPEWNASSISLAVVERGDQCLRMELAGSEVGDWLEWHSADSKPESFLSGLSEFYRLQRYQRLDEHWYLARYHPPTLSPPATSTAP